MVTINMAAMVRNLISESN